MVKETDTVITDKELRPAVVMDAEILSGAND